MKKKHSLLFCALFTIFTGHAESTDYTKGLSIWFDSPNTLQGKEVWHSAQRMPVGNHSHCPSAMEASVLIFWVQ